MSLVSGPRRAGGPDVRVAAARVAPEAEYAFLLSHINAETLVQATALATRQGVHPHDVLIATGWINAEDYYRALAGACGVPFKDALSSTDALPAGKTTPRQCLARGLLRERSRAKRFVLAPDQLRPNALRAMLAQLAPHDFALASPRTVREATYRHFAPVIAQAAVYGLAARRPDQSARSRTAQWQRLSLVIGTIVLLLALLLAPAETLRTLTLLLAVAFVPVIGLRIIAAYGILQGKFATEEQPDPRVADADLPTYTLLAPLYREAHMLPSLVQALTSLDWPAAKLDIKLILEAADTRTVAAARALNLPGNVEIVVVPDLSPRTKPKALNYALPLARGEYLVIFDAEDRPEPGQLRRAFNAFRIGPPKLATVQARLNIYNSGDNWLTRQFTLEYTALFDGLLPALDRLKLPIPLGGTSNHFRVSALKSLMAWDPFNVTEDADLGTRLARHGYRCQVIASTTYEEAPQHFMSWGRQRTRWLKGFVQTWLVHMREPRTLWRELGPRGFLGFQVMVGGTILSALVHPWFYVLLGYELLGDGFLARPSNLAALPFWGVAWFDLITGYLAAMTLAFLALRRRGFGRLYGQVLLMPFYWLLISAAAYRALWQFATEPFKWEKTEHGQSAATRTHQS